MSNVLITHAQMQDTIRTYALLCNVSYAALGLKGLVCSEDAMDWNERNQEWRYDESAHPINNLGLSFQRGESQYGLAKYANYHTTEVKIDAPRNLFYHDDGGHTVIYDGIDLGDDNIVTLAEVRDMLEVFCHLTGFKYAGMSNYGIGYCNAPMRRRPRGWITTDGMHTKHYASVSDHMDLSPLSAAQQLATMVEVERVSEVRYEHDPNKHYLLLRKDKR